MLLLRYSDLVCWRRSVEECRVVSLLRTVQSNAEKQTDLNDIDDEDVPD